MNAPRVEGDMKRVLVVDDSGFQRTLVRDALTDGYEVVGEASDGTEAVETFDRLSPDVVTMDVMMPNTNGIEATARIKRASPETTVVMVTSVEQREQMKEAIRAGADGYVTKPFDGEEVRSAIDEAS